VPFKSVSVSETLTSARLSSQPCTLITMIGADTRHYNEDTVIIKR